MKVENNLFDRLTEESLAKFNLKKEEYPTNMALIEPDLKNNSHVVDLKYITILTLYNFDIVEDFRIGEVVKIFKH